MYFGYAQYKQKGFAPILIVLLIAAVVGGYFVYRDSSNNQTKPSPTSTTSQTPNPSPQEDLWQTYESGQNIDGIIINYPEGWKVNYRKEYNLSSDFNAKYRLSFDFSPPGWKSPESVNWMGWGSLSFNVYDKQNSVNEFINNTYRSKYRGGLVSKEDAKIGGRSTFLISSDGKSDWSVGWIPRDIIFGSNYTYELGHSQNGSDDFIKDVANKSGIFTYIKIN